MKKKLVVFCDGTWNEPDKNPTNVAKLFEATLQEDQKGIPQVVHYIQGVGTHWYDRMMGGMFGWGISENVKSGYRFLCSNYNQGDEIYLFGFSRGAYTARSLAGLIHNMGILRREHFDQVNQTYARYKDKSPDWHPTGPKTQQFRSEFTHGGEKIRFLGVWDTVGALGAPYGLILGYLCDLLFSCRFHDTKLSSSILSASHAISADEHRWPFRPTLWQLGANHNPQDFIEEWFPSVHSDVGGGYPETGLSDKALVWMADQATKQGLSTQVKLSPSPETAHNSQTRYYQYATLIAVKWPATALIDLPGKVFKNWPAWFYGKLNEIGLLAEPDIAEKVARIQANGDYWRR
ncbi:MULTISPECIES: DUF2235 domain-containing protein [Methylomonas]|uniref:DUF2235 domain-containing protein n=1 Tax=Methylomonas TaxID=416 RepID=UPI001232669A|nr:DUF2235 domain-containing protein [Methylomonas rhizoryzae]